MNPWGTSKETLPAGEVFLHNASRLCGGVAQLVEHGSWYPKVTGSIPVTSAIAFLQKLRFKVKCALAYAWRFYFTPRSMQKTVLITGSTSGIGLLTARRFAEAGHRVCLHGRNSKKLADVAKELASIGNGQAVPQYVADFSDLGQVRAMAADIQREAPQLDVLINNAGVFMTANPKTAAGLDVRFVVNTLAPCLLTELLLPLLARAADARVISLSSAAQSSVSLAALRGETPLADYEAYAQSKLALTMWSADLARRHPAITAIAANPASLLDTNMVQEAFGHARASADVGADILFRLATAAEYAGKTGQYFDNDRGEFAPAHPDTLDASTSAEVVQAVRDLAL